jgi:DNA-binding CsgD family transcriptional regulator
MARWIGIFPLHGTGRFVVIPDVAQQLSLQVRDGSEHPSCDDVGYALALRNPRAYPGVLEHPLAYWQKLAEKAGISSRDPGAVPELTVRLTPREPEVVCLVAEGIMNQEIALKLNLSEHNVRNYVLRIFLVPLPPEATRSTN